MACDCHKLDAICAECAETVSEGLYEAGLIEHQRPDRIMAENGWGPILWDLGVSQAGDDNPFLEAA